MRHYDQYYRPDIDGMRALAVGAVVLFHAYPHLLPGGFIGVDLFFVISGFLITSIIIRDLNKGNFSLLKFYQKRVRRIFPTLILMIVAIFLWSWFFLIPNEFKELSRHSFFGLIFSANFNLWFENDYFSALKESKPLLHLWSLGIEEQFYIAWPLILMWYSKKSRPVSLTNILSVLLLISFILNTVIGFYDKTHAFYSPLTRSWEIAAGALLALSERKFPMTNVFKNKKFLEVISVIVLAILVFTMKTLNENQFNSFYALIPIFSMIFFIGFGKESFLIQKIFQRKLLVWIGLISYPLYLWHWPIIVFGRSLVIDYNFPLNRTMTLAIILSLILAVITHVFIEKKIQTFQLSKTSKFLVVISIAVLCFNLYGFYGQGLPGRFKHIEHLSQFIQREIDHYPTHYREGTCFLKKDQSFQNFSMDCLNHDQSSTPLKSVMIWGDSYSAHLYPGLKALEKRKNFQILQANASACPPLLKYHSNDRPHCQKFNEEIFQRLNIVKPSLIILSGAWHTYYKNENFEEQLSNTIMQIQAHNIPILLLGPMLVMGNSPLKNSMLFYPNFSFHNTAYPELKIIDAKIQSIAEKYKVQYFSPVEALCTHSSQCLYGSTDSHQNEFLFTWDAGHLTSKGSEFLVDLIFQRILQF